MITTHVLDTANGRPAAGIGVTLHRDGTRVGSGVTDADGRCRTLGGGEPGVYRLTFEVVSYFPDGFYPSVSIDFVVRDGSLHHHVPLLLSPWGFTTYRGS